MTYKPELQAEASPATLSDALAAEQRAAAEQLAAAWQIHVTRVEELLEAGWRDNIQRVFTERFGTLEARLRSAIEAAAEERYRQTEQSRAPEIREQALEEMSQAARRFRLAQSEEELRLALIEAGGRATGRLLLLEIDSSGSEPMARAAGSSGFSADLATTLPSLAFPLSEAPAVASAVETVDSVITLRVPAELSESVTAAVGEDSEGRVVLVPIATGSKTTLVLYGDNEGRPVSIAALELISHLAAGALGLLGAAGAWASGPAPVSPEDELLQLRAQRMARVVVAELRLYHASKVHSGRANGNLYGTLRREIDHARERYRSEYLSQAPSLPDYLHAELVRNLANDDANLLGPEYPGPLA